MVVSVRASTSLRICVLFVGSVDIVSYELGRCPSVMTWLSF